MSTRIVCSECIKKQEEIYRLREEVQRLKAQLHRQDRKITEGYFGSSTPSSKRPVKKNSTNDGEEKKRGGAKPGHKGNGRRSASVAQADRVEEVKADCCCPQCHSHDLEALGQRERTVIDYEIKKVKIVYQLERKRCKGCGTVVQAKAPGVLSKNLYSNNLLAHVATEHYVNGIRLGHLERQTGVNVGSLIEAMHQLGGMLQDVPDKLIEEYRQAAVNTPTRRAGEGMVRTAMRGYLPPETRVSFDFAKAVPAKWRRRFLDKSTCRACLWSTDMPVTIRRRAKFSIAMPIFCGTFRICKKSSRITPK